MATPRFEPGQLLVHRQFVTHDQLSCARTARVVAHDDVGLRLWIATGNPVMAWEFGNGRGIRDMSFPEWISKPRPLVPQHWRGADILMFLPAGSNHSIWWFWQEHGDFGGWYVNLEESGVFWQDDDLVGVDTVDQDLDVMVAPDRTWQWKDVEEFTERLAYGQDYWVSDGEAVWAEGRRIIEVAEAGAFPFDGTWQDWRPDPTWTKPVAMPDGWDRPRAR